MLVLIFIVAFIFGFLVRSCLAKETVIMHDDLTPEVFTVLDVMGPEVPSVVPTEPIEMPASTYDVDFVADIILDVNNALEPDQAHAISNEIIYQMGVYGMDQYEDMPYILALYYQESTFNPLAKNPRSSARGVGQILMSLHSWKFDEYNDWMNIEDNIAVSFQILHGSYDPDRALGPRWRQVYRTYSGGACAGYMRHVDRFAYALNCHN